MDNEFYSVDLFSGCGGLTQGMHDAGFVTKVAVEIDPIAVRTYRMNHLKTNVIEKDIRKVSAREILDCLGEKELHLLAGCPPCQGFSSVRRLNRPGEVKDSRNNLVQEYFRLIKELRPLTIMMENVPGLKHYELFQNIVKKLDKMGYTPEVKIVDVKDYGIPQRRKRLVLVGSRIGPLGIVEGKENKVTVRDTIYNLPAPENSNDPLHRIVAQHTKRIIEQIRLTPKDGGSRRDLPPSYTLPCHSKEGIGFNDVYGRLRWKDYSTTITGGCLNPSKGRFLHPEQDRVITPREAALLQSFPPDYKFPTDIPKQSLALMIGNALPPKFSYCQSLNIYRHLEERLQMGLLPK